MTYSLFFIPCWDKNDFNDYILNENTLTYYNFGYKCVENGCFWGTDKSKIFQKIQMDDILFVGGDDSEYIIPCKIISKKFIHKHDIFINKNYNNEAYNFIFGIEPMYDFKILISKFKTYYRDLTNLKFNFDKPEKLINIFEIFMKDFRPINKEEEESAINMVEVLKENEVIKEKIKKLNKKIQKYEEQICDFKQKKYKPLKKVKRILPSVITDINNIIN